MNCDEQAYNQDGVDQGRDCLAFIYGELPAADLLSGWCQCNEVTSTGRRLGWTQSSVSNRGYSLLCPY